MLNLLYATWSGINQSDIFRQWTPRYGQYLTHAHNHITTLVAAIDSCFALIGAHQGYVMELCIERSGDVHPMPAPSDNCTSEIPVRISTRGYNNGNLRLKGTSLCNRNMTNLTKIQRLAHCLPKVTTCCLKFCLINTRSASNKSVAVKDCCRQRCRYSGFNWDLAKTWKHWWHWWGNPVPYWIQILTCPQITRQRRRSWCIIQRQSWC